MGWFLVVTTSAEVLDSRREREREISREGRPEPGGIQSGIRASLSLRGGLEIQLNIAECRFLVSNVNIVTLIQL